MIDELTIEALGRERRPVVWISGAKKELLLLPSAVIEEFATVLRLAQHGEFHRKSKKMIGVGPGVHEAVMRYDRDTYRMVYTIHYRSAVYVITAFKKKSKSGVKTDLPIANKIRLRLHIVENEERS